MIYRVRIEQSICVYKKKKSLFLVSLNKKVSVGLEDNVLVYFDKKKRLLYIKSLEQSHSKICGNFFKKILAKEIGRLSRVLNIAFSLVKVPKNFAFLIGLGYKFEFSKNMIFLKLGFSHNLKILVPFGIQVFIPKENILLLKSSSKENLNTFMHILQKYKKPDQYKNKGVILNWQIIRNKKIIKSS